MAKAPEDFYKEPDPYVDAPSCNVNLLELSRYAREHGKQLTELTEEEVKQFSIDKEESLYKIDIEKLKSRIVKTISTEEALSDVEPMKW